MTIKSLISSVALAAALGFGSAAGALAQVEEPNVNNLTPAEKTQLEDQCRQLQNDTEDSSSESDSENDDDDQGAFKVSEAFCAQLGVTG